MKLVTKLVPSLVGFAAAPLLIALPALDIGPTALQPVFAGLGVATLLASGGSLVYVIVKSVVRPCAALNEALDRLGGGDFTTATRIPASTAEIASLGVAIERVREKILDDENRRAADRAASEQAASARRAAQETESRGYVEAHELFMSNFTSGLEKLSLGDLSHRLTQPFSSDYEKLRHCYNLAIDKLRSAFSDMIGNVHGLNSKTGEIAAAADALAQRTEQQAASLAETTSALAQISTTVDRTSEGAQNAARVVSDVRVDAEKSSEIVRRAIDAMGRIQGSSHEIGQIIGVIDEIAFQTNLLALNAGVEAARAGEAGRGFAVVASEVRALAQRSAEAAKEIKGLISTSSAQVEEGVSLVAQTGTALGRIVGQVSQANKVVAEIAEGAQEQATGLREVNAAVSQMDQFTQQNAAMVEETTASSHGLKYDIEQLAHSLAKFDLGERVAEDASTRRGQDGLVKRSQPSPRAGRAVSSRGSAVALQTQSQPAEQNWEDF